jgi:hypothetical protein
LENPGNARKLRHRNHNKKSDGERDRGTNPQHAWGPTPTIFDWNWSDDVDTLIQACAYALRVTLPATGPYSPAELSFGYDLIFRQKVIVDWERIKAIRVKQAIENNKKENRKRLVHEFIVGDKVLILHKAYDRRNNPKISPSTHSRGPFRITEILENGTVKIQCGAYVDLISIRRLTRYK